MMDSQLSQYFQSLKWLNGLAKYNNRQVISELKQRMENLVLCFGQSTRIVLFRCHYLQSQAKGSVALLGHQKTIHITCCGTMNFLETSRRDSMLVHVFTISNQDAKPSSDRLIIMHYASPFRSSYGIILISHQNQNIATQIRPNYDLGCNAIKTTVYKSFVSSIRK